MHSLPVRQRPRAPGPPGAATRDPAGVLVSATMASRSRATHRVGRVARGAAMARAMARSACPAAAEMAGPLERDREQVGEAFVTGRARPTRPSVPGSPPRAAHAGPRRRPRGRRADRPARRRRTEREEVSLDRSVRDGQQLDDGTGVRRQSIEPGLDRSGPGWRTARRAWRSPPGAGGCLRPAPRRRVDGARAQVRSDARSRWSVRRPATARRVSMTSMPIRRASAERDIGPGIVGPDRRQQSDPPREEAEDLHRRRSTH